MQFPLHKPGVRYSAPAISYTGYSTFPYTEETQNNTNNNNNNFIISYEQQQQQQQQSPSSSLGFITDEINHNAPLPNWTNTTYPFGGNTTTTTTNNNNNNNNNSFPFINSYINHMTPGSKSQNNNNNINYNIASAPTAPIITKTATSTTTLSAGKRSGTSQSRGECIIALIDNRASEVGIALCQLPSLSIIITQYGDSVAFAKTLSFVFARNPLEILIPETAIDGKFVQTLLRHFRDVTFTGVQRRTFDEAQGANRLLHLMSTGEACLEVSNTDRYLCVAAANALIEFVEMSYNYILLPHTIRVQYLALENYMEISRLSARALHLIPTGGVSSRDRVNYTYNNNNNNNTKKRSKQRKTLFRSSHDASSSQNIYMLPLVEALNHTITGVGRRLLRSTILQPLRDTKSIELRYDSVQYLQNSEEALTQLRRVLQPLYGNDLEWAISTFSHEAKVTTIKTMQQRIEAVVTLWQLLRAAVKLAETLGEILMQEGNERESSEFQHHSSWYCSTSTSSNNSDNNNNNSLNSSDNDDNDNKEEFPNDIPMQRKRPRSDRGRKSNNSNKRNNAKERNHFAYSKQQNQQDIFNNNNYNYTEPGVTNTTLLRKLLETLTVCRMEEICAEIANYLDEGVVKATGGRGPQFNNKSNNNNNASVAQRVRRPGSAILQVQQCFAVKPNINGTLDSARHQYSQAVEAMFAYTEELKQKYGVGSLRVVYDGIRGYHLSYDSRHESNAPDSIFLQKYSGGSHYSLYHSSRSMMMNNSNNNNNEIGEEEVEEEENDENNNIENINSISNSITRPPWTGNRVHALATEDSRYFLNNEESFSMTNQKQQQSGKSLNNNNNNNNLTKHQVRGRRVMCTTKELLLLRRCADDAVAEIFQTQDSLVLSLIEYLRQRLGKLQAVCDAVALLDLLVAFATYSRINACTRPIILPPDNPLDNNYHNNNNKTYFIEARHPGGVATANTIRWHHDSNVILLTGPNASGKTTLLKQVGQLIALAQSGCLIPAKSAAIQPCDRLITHMLCDDAEDAMSSSFAKEMRELSYICLHTTRESIILIDELGRRTAVREGTGIAWATIEFLIQTRCRAIFVTHFSRLTNLANVIGTGVRNYHLAVSTGNDKENNNIISSSTNNTNNINTNTGRGENVGSLKMIHKPVCTLCFEYKLLPGPSQVDHYGLRLAEKVGFFVPALNLAKELLPIMMKSKNKNVEDNDLQSLEINKGINKMNSPTRKELNENKQVSTTNTTIISDIDTDSKNYCDESRSRSGSNREIRKIKKENNNNNNDTSGTAPRLSGASGISTIMIVSDGSSASNSLQDFTINL